MRFLVTGAAGFIGYHVAKRLLDLGYYVVGFDNFNRFYDVRFKEARNKILEKNPKYKMVRGSVEDESALAMAFDIVKPEYVIHLASQAGLRPNVIGFQNVVKNVQVFRPRNFVYASADRFSCGNLEGIPSTGLRFFHVYGPLSRPDMPLFQFAKAIRLGRSIHLINEGNIQRDFLFIEDAVDGLMLAVQKPQIDKAYNLGYGSVNNLITVVEHMAKIFKHDLSIDFVAKPRLHLQSNVVDISLTKKELGYNPIYDIENGLPIFCDWFKELKSYG